MNDDQKIYQEIANILASIMSSDAIAIIFDGFIYDTSSQIGCTNILLNNQKEFINLPSNLFIQLRNLIQKLQKCKIFANEKWTHFEVHLSKDGKFKMNFAYIPEEDSWVNLIMKGISDLSEEESSKLGIPKDLWLERIKHKGTGTSGKPKSEFY